MGNIKFHKCVGIDFIKSYVNIDESASRIKALVREGDTKVIISSYMCAGCRDTTNQFRVLPFASARKGLPMA